MRRSILSLSLCLLAAATAGCNGTLVRVSESFVLDLPWDDYQRVVVRTRNGHVELLAGDTEALCVSGTKKAGGLTWDEAAENLAQLKIVAEPDETDPTTFVIELEAPASLRHKSPGASFDIRVPRACAADVETDNGHIRVRGARDSVHLRTGNGRITVEQVDGRVEAFTSNGLIHAEFITPQGRTNYKQSRVFLMREAV